MLLLPAIWIARLPRFQLSLSQSLVPCELSLTGSHTEGIQRDRRGLEALEPRAGLSHLKTLGLEQLEAQRRDVRLT